MSLPTLLVANENSRRGGEVAPFVQALERGGLLLRRESCESGEQLAATIRALKDEVAAVVLGGGDGTMHAAAPALLETGLPLGLLPLGTANDLARTLGVPTEGAGAAAVILEGRTRTIDLGTVNGVPYFNVASIGLSVGVTKRLQGIMKRRLGPLAYPVAAAVTVISDGRFSAVLRSDDGEVAVTTLQVTVGNGRHYGGGAVVERDAAIDDGVLHVYSLEPRARWRLIAMARAFRDGEHDRLREVRNFATHRLHVQTKREEEISADGEIVASTPAEFGLLRHAMRVFVP